MNEQHDDLICFADAVRELGVSRQTLFRRIDDCGLTRYKLIGDSRVYLNRADVERLKHPQAVPNRLNRTEQDTGRTNQDD